MLFGKDYSKVYDALYKDQNFQAEAAAVVSISKETIATTYDRLKLLDLGCGTGNHSILFRDNFNVTGVDLSDDMLSIARQKVPGVDFRQGDARSVDLNDRFDIVCMMSAVLGYQHTNDQVIDTFRNVRKHLEPWGTFIFDVWYGPAILLERPIPRLREFDVDGVHLVRSMTPTLCADKNLVSCHYKWWVPNGDKLEIREEHHVQRYFFPLEIKLMLEATGFKLYRYGHPGYAYRPINDNNRDVMFVAVAV